MRLRSVDSARENEEAGGVYLVLSVGKVPCWFIQFSGIIWRVTKLYVMSDLRSISLSPLQRRYQPNTQPKKIKIAQRVLPLRGT